MAADDQDLRSRLATSLDGITDEFLAELRDQLFSQEKLTMADCPHCGKSAKVRVPDYRGITTALAILADQGKGKPSTAAPPAPEMSQAELERVAREVLRDLSVSELARLAG